MGNTKKSVNPWTKEDEKEHYPSVIEWWGFEAFFKSVEDNKQWGLKGSCSQFCNRKKQPGSNCIITLFDIEKNKHFHYYSRDTSRKLESIKDNFHVKYRDCFIKGLFPDYDLCFKDPENKIELNLNSHAESLPHWVAQDITNGWLPMGSGLYRYGFIPKNKLSGTMKIKNKKYTVEGISYFEHVWGNFSYSEPLTTLGEFTKSLSKSIRLLGWWIHYHTPKIPKSIMFSTENNPLGYDWTWAVFDNGWSLFYGNILLFVMKGPAAGILIFTKDGKIYTEFANITFQYNKIKYAKDYDFYYPIDFELEAIKGKEKLHLRFKAITDPFEFLLKFKEGKSFLGFIICETPGMVEGYYTDGSKKISLKGVCKMEPQRQTTNIGHNSLKLDFLLPPKGVGIKADFNSHYFKKRINMTLNLAPQPHLRCKFKRVAKKDFGSEKL